MSTKIKLALVKHTTHVTDKQMRQICDALNQQILNDFQPLWPSLDCPKVVIADNDQALSNPSLYPVYVEEGNSDTWGAGFGGFHGITGDGGYESFFGAHAHAVTGRPYAVVQIKKVMGAGVNHTPTVTALPVLQNAVLAGVDNLFPWGTYSVATALSHEVLELLADPVCNLCTLPSYISAEAFDLWTGQLTFEGAPFLFRNALREVCDPVAFDSGYDILVDKKVPVSVSNAVSQDWFNVEYAYYTMGMPPTPGLSVVPPTGVKYDILGQCPAPFVMSPGGGYLYMTGYSLTRRGPAITGMDRGFPAYLHPVLGQWFNPQVPAIVPRDSNYPTDPSIGNAVSVMPTPVQAGQARVADMSYNFGLVSIYSMSLPTGMTAPDHIQPNALALRYGGMTGVKAMVKSSADVKLLTPP